MNAPARPGISETLEHIATGKLIPYASNARTHTEQQVAQIAASIREFGFTNPVLIDEGNGIIAGHGRVMAAQLLNRDTVPCLRLSGLSDAQKRAYVIADNKLALNAGWNEELLAAELKRLSDEGYAFEVTGFSRGEMDDLVNAFGLGDVRVTRGGDPEDGGAGSTDLAVGVLKLLDVAIKEPFTKVEVGEHWRLGDHDLVCASVIEAHRFWVPLLREDSFLCPYPGVFVPFASGLHEGAHLLMVQPDPYVAGHIIDRFREAHGQVMVERVGRVMP